MGNLFAGNKTPYREDLLIGLAKRQNNARRPFLIVNKMQGKHIPADPRETLSYFSLLGKLAAERCEEGENILVIGFAETATAVGAAVAIEISGSVYCHTTREPVRGRHPTVEFLEEHSHATGHALYMDGMTRFDRIIFVDDEITTGKTVVNFIRALEKSKLVRPDVKYTVAALIFSLRATDMLNDDRVSFAFLTRIDTSNVAAPDIKPISANQPSCEAPGVNATQVHGLRNPREGIVSEEYSRDCEHFAESAARLMDVTGEDILVLGSEEFMYPPLILGAFLRARGRHARCHATTRSPIEPFDGEGYPIKSQWPIPSLYDASRETYLYNLRKYDSVIIATDAPQNRDAELQIRSVLGSVGNKTIYIVRWAA